MLLNFKYTDKDLEGLVTSGHLTDQESRCIELLYGIADGKCYTEAEASRMMRVTRLRLNVLRRVAEGKLNFLHANGAVNGSGIDKNLEAALFELRKNHPTLCWRPNMAQERACRVWEKPNFEIRSKDKSGKEVIRFDYPFIQVLAFANGVGKTNFLAIDIAGTCLGPRYLNDCWYRDASGNKVSHSGFQYYHELTALRDAGKLACRIVCDKEDMKDNGSLYSEIKSFIPTAIFKTKTSSGCWTSIIIPHPDLPGVSNTIDVKTFEQDVTAHSGSNLLRIWMNEPPPYKIFSENVGRTRSKVGEAQARIVLAATAVDTTQSWIWDVEEQENAILQRGSTWENCDGSQLTDEIAKKVREKIGVDIPRDEMGNYVTHGILSRESIENQISTWAKVGEDEVRTYGQNVSRQGRIYINFNKDVHVRSGFNILPNWPIVQIVDPHPVKPDAAIWVAIDPFDRKLVIKESPTQPYESMKKRELDIDQTCELWSNIEKEMGIQDQIVMRIGDPNRFPTQDSRDNKKLSDLYAKNNFHFCLNVPDDLNLGHKEVMKLIHYNAEFYNLDPMAPSAQPMLQIHSECRNSWTAMMKYAWNGNKNQMAAPSECVNEQYKDFADLIRYLAVMQLRFSYLSDRLMGVSKDYELVLRGRDPYAQKVRNGQGRILSDYEKIQKTRGELPAFQNYHKGGRVLERRAA